MTKRPPTRKPNIDWSTVLADADLAALLNLHRRWASDTGATAVVATHDRLHLEQTRRIAYTHFGRDLEAAEAAARKELAAAMSTYTDPDVALAAAHELANARADLDAWRSVWGMFAPEPAWASKDGEWSDLLNNARIHHRPRAARWVAKQKAAGVEIPGDRATIDRLEVEARREELEQLVADENDTTGRQVHDFGSIG